MAEGLMNNRPESIDVHAAVCGEFRTVHWLSSGNVGGIVEFMAQARGGEREGVKRGRDGGGC